MNTIFKWRYWTKRSFNYDWWCFEFSPSNDIEMDDDGGGVELTVEFGFLIWFVAESYLNRIEDI
jgi:hypothetical protein